MTAMPNIVALVNTIRGLGATPPAELTDAVELYDAAWTAGGDPAQTLADVTDRADDGTLTAANSGKTITDAANRLNTQIKARDIAQDLGGHIVARVNAQIRGSLGTQIVDAIRTQFDVHAQAIADCPFSPDTASNPTQVIALGDKAVAAWRALPGHAQAIDRIYGDLVIPLARDFGLITPRAWPRADVPYIAWMIDGDHRADPLTAAAIATGALGTREPGGRWHRLHSNGFRLRLNSPAETEALLQNYSDALEAQQRRDVAARTPAEAAQEQQKRRSRQSTSDRSAPGPVAPSQGAGLVAPGRR